MDKEKFENSLNELGLNREELAIELGVSYPTVRSWYVKDKKMPLYAQKFLEKLIELQKYKNLYVDIKLLYKNMDDVKQNLEELEF